MVPGDAGIRTPICQSSNGVSTRHESPQASELWDMGGKLRFPFTLCSDFLSVVKKKKKKKATLTKSNLGNEGVYFQSESVTEGSHGKNLKQTPWRKVVCQLILSSLIHLKTSWVGHGAAHSGLCPPAPINNQISRVPYGHAHRPVWAGLGWELTITSHFPAPSQSCPGMLSEEIDHCMWLSVRVGGTGNSP